MRGGIVSALNNRNQSECPVLTKPPVAQLLIMPLSLEGHDVPPDRLLLIAPHIQALAATALAVSDELPLQADTGDFAATLEAEAE